MKSFSLLFSLIVLALPTVVLGQVSKKDVFANPQNLKVLPKDISAKELGETMKGFATGLGVRCETCHVGRGPSQSFSSFRSELAS